MASLNKALIIGNLGKDPEVRMTPSGQSVATFPVATAEKFRSKSGEWEERTEWHNVYIGFSLALSDLLITDKNLDKTAAGIPAFILALPLLLIVFRIRNQIERGLLWVTIFSFGFMPLLMVVPDTYIQSTFPIYTRDSDMLAMNWQGFARGGFFRFCWRIFSR